MLIFNKLDSESQAGLIKKAISIGNVLKIECSFTNPPKNKRIILVNTNPLIGFFIINSKLNEFVMNSDLITAQILINSAEHSFIEHDSYVACEEIIYCVSKEEIESQLRNDYSRFLGSINQNLRDLLIATCLQSETLKPIEIELVCENLKSLQFD